MPTRFDFETFLPCECDIHARGVLEALAHMGWESTASPRPLLVVDPRAYLDAVACNRALDRLCVVVTSRQLPRDAWFVAWRNRRMGSAGA